MFEVAETWLLQFIGYLPSIIGFVVLFDLLGSFINDK